MSDLRFVRREGDYLQLADLAGSTFTVRISDGLRAAVNEERLTPIREATPVFSVREIQARLRAGEDFAEVARISGLSIEKIERYASPILQERAWIIEQAEKSTPKGASIVLHDLVIERLAPRGVNINQIAWNTWRLDNGSWHLLLSYPGSDGQRECIWHFDANKRTLIAQDDGARWINGEEINRPSQRSEITNASGPVFPGEGEPPAPPRLVAVRTDPVAEEQPMLTDTPVDAKKDGVTRRISIPSWDDIMFGRSKKKDEE